MTDKELMYAIVHSIPNFEAQVEPRYKGQVPVSYFVRRYLIEAMVDKQLKRKNPHIWGIGITLRDIPRKGTYGSTK